MLFSVERILTEIQPYAGNSGTCNQTIAMRYMNKARSLLWNKTDTDATCEYVCIRCVDRCLTLPGIYKQIRLAWLDGAPVSIGNEWYKSIPQGGVAGGNSGFGVGNGFSQNNSCHRKLVEMGGNHVTFQNYPQPYRLNIQSESSSDAGVQITFFGENQYSTKISETITLGTLGESVYSTQIFNNLQKVTKPYTKGRVRVYAYDANNNLQQLISVYQPYDINPSFLRFAVSSPRYFNSNSQGNITSNDGCHQVTVYAKKNYHDLTQLDELVEFTPEAMIHAVMAIVYRENKGSDQLYSNSLLMAINEVNLETADTEEPVGSPLRQFNPNNDHALIPTAYCEGWAWPV